MREKIIGTGSALPDACIDNQMLMQMVDTSDEWIQSRTGIRQRHIVKEETVVSLAAAAARQAMENAAISPEEIDLILVATSSSEMIYPCAAAQVQAAIGAVHAGCLDLNAACTGFLTAYQMAAGQIRARMAKNVLVIGAEALSHLVDWTDRTTCILFGDGAGAAVVAAEDSEEVFPDTEPCTLLCADGSQGNALTCSSGFIPKDPDGRYIAMDGRAIYQFAVKKVPEVIRQLLRRGGCSADEIDYFILHQANGRIIESIARHLHQPMEKFPMNLMETGNMSAASIPVLLDHLNRAGKLQRGMKLILAGFGAGLAWGGTLITY